MDNLGVNMYWNYRVVKKQLPRNPDGTVDNSKPEYLEYNYGIHEVYYDHEDRATMVTQDAQQPYGETVEELISCWAGMAEAFTKPILDFDSIPEEGAYNEVEEAMKDIQDEEGNIRSTEELIEEGKLVSHEVVMKDLREKLGLKDFDMKEYRNEQIVEQNKAETEFNNNFVGNSVPEIFVKSLEILAKNDWMTDENEETDDE